MKAAVAVGRTEYKVEEKIICFLLPSYFLPSFLPSFLTSFLPSMAF